MGTADLRRRWREGGIETSWCYGGRGGSPGVWRGYERSVCGSGSVGPLACEGGGLGSCGACRRGFEGVVLVVEAKNGFDNAKWKVFRASWSFRSWYMVGYVVFAIREMRR